MNKDLFTFVSFDEKSTTDQESSFENFLEEEIDLTWNDFSLNVLTLAHSLSENRSRLTENLRHLIKRVQEWI